jgi:DtxR family Mn-dependent transcriptional regulator
MDWVTADREAARLEHAVSDVVEQRLYETLGKPATCPHGNPIPGYSESSSAEVKLSDLPTGDGATVARISEVAEREAPVLLGYLFDRRLVPGAELTVLEVDPVAHTLRVDVGGSEVTVGSETSEKVWVVPHPAGANGR